MSFNEETIQQVWEKGKVVENQDRDVKRQDSAQALIHREDYGDRDSEFGWEIDHIEPDGGDDLSNLQPLQWENNVAKQDGSFDPVVTSEGDRNVPFKKEDN